LNEDKNTGFITLSIKHQSPFIAKEWAELMIRKVNAFYREKDKLESENAVNYLSQKIKGTDLSEIKLAIADLLQEETKKLALIEANQYYVFDYIDPPAIMEQKSGPKRSLICIISALLGAISAIFLVLIHHYFIKEED
jgi:LPS O-antigen subunit length determinant protein (WzzB/FepE family)